MSIQSSLLSTVRSVAGVAKAFPNIGTAQPGPQIGSGSLDYDSNKASQAMVRVDVERNARMAQKTNLYGGNNGSQIT